MTAGAKAAASPAAGLGLSPPHRSFGPPPTAPLAMRIQQEATTVNKQLAASISPPTLLSIRGAASHPSPSMPIPAPAPTHHAAATHLPALPSSHVTPAPRGRDTTTSRWASSPTVSPVAPPHLTSSTSPLPSSAPPPATSPPKPQGLGMDFLRDESARTRAPDTPNAMGQIEAMLAKLRTSTSSNPSPASRASAPPTILRSTPVAAPPPSAKVAHPPTPSAANPLLARISEPKQPALGGRSRWDYDGENVDEVPIPVVEKTRGPRVRRRSRTKSPRPAEGTILPPIGIPEVEPAPVVFSKAEPAPLVPRAAASSLPTPVPAAPTPPVVPQVVAAAPTIPSPAPVALTTLAEPPLVKTPPAETPPVASPPNPPPTDPTSSSKVSSLAVFARNSLFPSPPSSPATFTPTQSSEPHPPPKHIDWADVDDLDDLPELDDWLTPTKAASPDLSRPQLGRQRSGHSPSATPSPTARAPLPPARASPHPSARAPLARAPPPHLSNSPRAPPRATPPHQAQSTPPRGGGHEFPSAREGHDSPSARGRGGRGRGGPPGAVFARLSGIGGSPRGRGRGRGVGVGVAGEGAVDGGRW